MQVSVCVSVCLSVCLSVVSILRGSYYAARIDTFRRSSVSICSCFRDNETDYFRKMNVAPLSESYSAQTDASLALAK